MQHLQSSNSWFQNANRDDAIFALRYMLWSGFRDGGIAGNSGYGLPRSVLRNPYVSGTSTTRHRQWSTWIPPFPAFLLGSGLPTLREWTAGNHESYVWLDRLLSSSARCLQLCVAWSSSWSVWWYQSRVIQWYLLYGLLEEQPLR